MMKQLLLASLLLFSFCGSIYAQSPSSSVKGKVADEGGEVLQFATVMLQQAADSSLVKAGYSDEKGTFSFEPVSAGKYKLEIRYTGLKTVHTEAFSVAEGAAFEVPPVVMSAGDATIEEVKIRAEKPLVTVKPDMTVFNVANSPNAIGSDAMELMRKAPGVVVDNNDNIMLLGKSGVVVYVNGKPSPLRGAELAAWLRTMQSSDIEAIEVITNPSAKYDAEGNAGILNIRLKKDKRMGANASVNLGYNVGVYSRYNGGVRANYRSKKINAFGGVRGFMGQRYEFVDLYREQNGTVIDQSSETTGNFQSQSFRAGLDVNIDKKNTVGFMASGYMEKRDREANSLANISDQQSGATQNWLQSNTTNDDTGRNLNLNLNYQHDAGEGVTYNVDADYGTYGLRGTSWQPNIYFDPTRQTVVDERNFRTIMPTDIEIVSLKADHERPLAGGQLGAGVKFARVVTDNTFDFYNVAENVETLDETRSNQFSYTEMVSAAYVSYMRPVKKFTFQAGLRAEQTNSSGVLTAMVPTNNDRVDRSYLSLFPSAGITWNQSQQNVFRINYSRRVDRPRYRDLNPFEQKLDELTYSRGNPFLQPMFTHNFSFTHTYKYVLNTTLSYSRTDDFIAQILDTADSLRAFQTQGNLGQRNVLNLNTGVPIPIAKWWSTYTTAGVTYKHNIGNFGEGKDIDANRTNFNIYHQSTFKVAGPLSFQLSGWYNSASLWGANFRIDPMFSIDAGANVKFFEGRGSLNLSVQDIFWSQQYRGQQEIGDLFIIADGGNDTRRFKANFTWLFGNDQVKSRKRKTGLEDEKGRVN